MSDGALRCWLRTVAWAVLLAAASRWPAATLAAEPVVSYSQGEVVDARQTLALRKEPSAINSSDLRPVVSGGARIHYAYALGTDASLKLPLRLEYVTDRGLGRLGRDWQLTCDFPFGRGVRVDLDRPDMKVYRGQTGDALHTSCEAVPVQPAAGLQDQVFVTRDLHDGARYYFASFAGGEDAWSVLPLRIEREGGENVEFRYDLAARPPRLEVVKDGSTTLNFSYTTELLRRITCAPPGADQGGGGLRWSFDYEPDADRVAFLLHGITCDSSTARTLQLRFSYECDARTESPDARVDLYSPHAPRHSAWRKVVNNPRWKLPDNLSLRNAPGLRFMDLNRDGEADLVDTKPDDGRLRSWIWDRNAKSWRAFGDRYRAYRPSVRSNRPTGSHYAKLYKEFDVTNKNTDGFQAILTSYYQPSADRKSLEYQRYACFPNVFGKQLQPDDQGNIWNYDDDPRLQLPVPLQYEGNEPWAPQEPGMATMERFDQQGAQLISFREGRLALFYIAARYRDAATGRILLAKHRDTGNCDSWFEDTWTSGGQTRRVKVDLCQAFWIAEGTHWSQDFAGKSFWRRLDLDENGAPNGQYILPWHKDKSYYFHYDGFRNVQFAHLAHDKLFAVVHARRKSGTWPAARDIYVLDGPKWVPAEGRDYPPQDFFEYDGAVIESGMFVNVDGQGADDAVVPTGSGSRRTFINNQNWNPRWRHCPAFDIPREVNLTDGSAQLVDLNNDEALDILVGRGSEIYINQAKTGRNRMKSFTDETGAQKHVADIP